MSKLVNININTIGGYYGGGGVKEYVPTDFEGLQYWFDISKLEGYSDGDPIESIPSAFDGGFALQKINDARRALYRPTAANGLPAMEQVANGGYLNPSGNFEVTNFLHQSSSTLFWVIKPTTLTGVGQHLLDSRGNTSANIGRIILLNTAGLLSDTCGKGGGDHVFNCLSVGGLIENQWSVVVNRFDNDVTTDAYKMEIDNILKATVNKLNAPSEEDSESTTRWFINAAVGSGSHFRGQVAEWGGYNRYLSDDELGNLIGGLITKFGE